MRILFVCTGNICRSPAAEVILRTKRPDVLVDSAAMGPWHIGEPPYSLMQDLAAKRGYDMSVLSARLVDVADFSAFDLIVAMDQSHLDGLKTICPQAERNKIVKMGAFASGSWRDADVPDPYYTRNFDETLDILENAIEGLIFHLDRLKV